LLLFCCVRATSIPGSSVFGNESVSLSNAVVTLSSIPAGFGTAHISASSPRVVLVPVVQHVAAFKAIQKPDLHQGGNQCAVFARPVSSKLDVLIRHAGQVAVAAV
jgi:hypothetical protein